MMALPTGSRAAVLSLLLSAGLATAAIAPTAADGLPVGGTNLAFFDIRLNADHSPALTVASELELAQGSLAWRERETQRAALASRIPLLTVDDDGLVGTPRSVRSTVSFLTAPDAKASTTGVVAAFVDDNAALFEYSGFEVRNAKVVRDYRTAHNGMRHIAFRQQINGIDLFRTTLKANVTADGRLLNVGGNFLPRPEGDFATHTPSIGADAALRLAAASVGVAIAGDLLIDTPAQGVSARSVWKANVELRSDEPIVTEFVYFPVSRTDIRAAWTAVIPAKGLGHTYDIVVDAVSGEILYRHDRLVLESTQPVTMRVYTYDSPTPGSPGPATPNGTQFPFLARSLVTINPADVIAFSPNGWINDGGTETVGNNVDSHLDLDSNNIADLPRPNGGPARVFDFPLDPTQAPSTFRNAAVVQFFYYANMFHDRLFALGFDEAAGNFQTINFTGAGSAGDAVQADCQDGATLSPPNANNANFGTTGIDGSTARCQMYVFTGSTPDRDGTLDGDIVYHELAHGLSIRCHGPDTLSGTQPQGQGEGWSDFFGITLNAEPSDDFNAVFGMGGYATLGLWEGGLYDDNYYFGIRRFPYSTDLLKNPHTLADIASATASNPAGVPININIANTATAVHNVGEVWCVSLLEARAALSIDHGFAANQLIMELVVDGMKNAPSDPTFLQSRDAILQSDLVNNGGANQSRLWQAFAKRGMGFSAFVPASAGTVGTIEAFDTPEFTTWIFPEGTPTLLNPGQSFEFSATVTGTNLTLVPNSGQLHYSIDGGAFTVVPLVATGPGAYTVSLPPADCFDNVAYYVSVNSNVGRKTFPTNAPTSTLAAAVQTGTSVLVTEAFEAESGWVVGPTTATTGAWQRADPSQTSSGSVIGQPGDDTTPGAGVNCFVTGATGSTLGENDVDGGSTILTSPAFNLAGAGEVEVSYNRWYSNSTGGAPGADVFVVDVSVNNGATWTRAETVGPSGDGTSGGWVRAAWRLSTLGLSPSAQVRVRFIAEDAGAGSVVEALIDDLTITEILCANPSCPADIDGDDDVDSDDIAVFFSAWDAGEQDYDGDDDTDSDDIAAFFSDWDGGC